MSRSYSAIHVHLVFSTKLRRPFLKDPTIRTEMHSYLGATSKSIGFQPLIVGGVEDHVHMLCQFGKQRSQSEWVKELKRVSSIWAKQRDPALDNFSWQIGCGVFSVGRDELDTVRNYIRKQEEHHKIVSFQDEFLRLLHEHDLEWEERDSWDE